MSEEEKSGLFDDSSVDTETSGLFDQNTTIETRGANVASGFTKALRENANNNDNDD